MTHELKRAENGSSEWLWFHITINSNRSYYDMADNAKASFQMFCDRVFKNNLTNYLVLRPWKRGRTKWIIGNGDNDPAIRPPPNTIKYLQTNISYEIGPMYNKLHAHVFLSIKSDKYEDYTLQIWHNLIRLEYEELFGAKCHLQFSRKVDEALKLKLYSMKKRDQTPELNHVSEVLIS